MLRRLVGRFRDFLPIQPKIMIGTASRSELIAVSKKQSKQAQKEIEEFEEDPEEDEDDLFDVSTSSTPAPAIKINNAGTVGGVNTALQLRRQAIFDEIKEKAGMEHHARGVAASHTRVGRIRQLVAWTQTPEELEDLKGAMRGWRVLGLRYTDKFMLDFVGESRRAGDGGVV